MLRVALLLAVLVVVALAVVLATRPDDAVLVPDVIDLHAQGETPASEAAVEGGRLTAPEHGWTHTRPVDALRADLRSPRHALKKRALDEIIADPTLGPRLLPGRDAPCRRRGPAARLVDAVRAASSA